MRKVWELFASPVEWSPVCFFQKGVPDLHRHGGFFESFSRRETIKSMPRKFRTQAQSLKKASFSLQKPVTIPRRSRLCSGDLPAASRAKRHPNFSRSLGIIKQGPGLFV
ncbi:hypothetical protein D8B26_004052 [Coccidioides posadasii str. Silveira]|uniref:uncharacterized protein n=1 Tax=Coccidioides posadasii (strain RMSCC 757 / Silveira) TaxID=443226 RepID=UPI001BF0704A|nr:hypothetical protein D8B26_004052 [Coccidioides posadasii str. Silveira]